jgi:cytochrome c
MQPSGMGTPTQPNGTSNNGSAPVNTPGQTGTTPSGMEGGGSIPLEPGMNMPPEPMSGGEPSTPSPEPAVLESVLVFTRTAGFRHDAIEPGVEAIRALGSANGFTVTQTEDAGSFSDAGLAPHDVVIFLSTTGDVLDGSQQAAFERYIRAGGGWVGVHAATDTEYDWPWYAQLIGNGAFFRSHPAIQTAVVNVEVAAHASTQHLPASFSFEDELYNFRANPRSAVTVLMTLDETSYSAGDGAMGADHPIAWYHEFDGGRAWYTALGHRRELYLPDADPARQESFTRFTQHVLGGIKWAAGVVP